MQASLVHFISIRSFRSQALWLTRGKLEGYGQSGPFAPAPGYDVMIEAEAGLMHITGEPDGQPVKVGVAITGASP
jgi:crotonobetainyl-CoA:carnitine CoA-transferase CaiB-like acyl-CoA transferase